MERQKVGEEGNGDFYIPTHKGQDVSPVLSFQKDFDFD